MHHEWLVIWALKWNILKHKLSQPLPLNINAFMTASQGIIFLITSAA